MECGQIIFYFSMSAVTKKSSASFYWTILKFIECTYRGFLSQFLTNFHEILHTLFSIHVVTRAGVNSRIEWELNSIPDSIPEIGLGIEKKGIGIELELTKYARN